MAERLRKPAGAEETEMKNEPLYHYCRKCMRMVKIISWGVYRNILVDAKAVEVIADPEGEDFVRIDGSKVMAREADPDETGTEWAYRPHRKTCGVSE